MKPFIWWGPDPEALAINALSQNWWWVPQMLKMLTREPVLLPRRKRTTLLWWLRAMGGNRSQKLLIFFTRSCRLWFACYLQIGVPGQTCDLGMHPGMHQPDSSMPPTSPDGTSSQFLASVIPIRPPLSIVLQFLTTLHEEGFGYSAINTARSALSVVVTLPDNQTVVRFLKGIFELRLLELGVFKLSCSTPFHSFITSSFCLAVLSTIFHSKNYLHNIAVWSSFLYSWFLPNRPFSCIDLRHRSSLYSSSSLRSPSDPACLSCAATHIISRSLDSQDADCGLWR